MTPEATSEALLLIADELDEQRQAISQLASAHAVANMAAKVDKMHDLLVDVLRSDEKRQRDYDQARKADQERYAKLAEKVDKLTHLRLANR